MIIKNEEINVPFHFTNESGNEIKKILKKMKD